MKLRKVTKGLLSTIMSAVLLTGALPFGGAGTQVEAATAPEKTVAGLGTTVIAAPEAPNAGDASWKGSYVWYGKYNSTPVKYRVLTPKSYDYGSAGMLLECDDLAFHHSFDEDGNANTGASNANVWKYSDIKESLNGNWFLNREGVFTEAEKNAINKSTISGHSLVVGTGAGQVANWTASKYKNYVALTGEKIFLLDAEEVSNPAYGYSAEFNGMPSRIKRYNDVEYWYLRSASSDGRAGIVFSDGSFDTANVTMNYGISPAFNVNTMSVLFSSVIKGTAGKIGAEYKLTIIDPNMTVNFLNGSNPTIEIANTTDPAYAGAKVNVNYLVTGTNAQTATQLSYLILDKEWDATNKNGAKILYYGRMETSTASSIYYIPTYGSASFRMPAGLSLDDWNRKYFVYMVAEDINDTHETDYATKPVKFPTPQVNASNLVISARAKYASIAKTSTQDFVVKTSSNVNYLMLYTEGAKQLVKTWAAAGNSTVSGSVRTWNVSLKINDPGNRALVFRGGTTSATAVTNMVPVAFTVLKTGVISASAKNAAIKAGGQQVFTVKTTADATKLFEYAEGGNLVKTWTASSSNSTVSGNVRTWTVSQNIQNAGKRSLIFKAGTSSTPTAAQRSAAFTVEDVWVNSASVKYASIRKATTQTFTVKTTSNAQYLMLYAEGGNLVKTWPAAGNSTVSGGVRTWTVNLTINTPGNRVLTLKAGKTTTPSALGKNVSFTVTAQ